jgi:hypothetical protein
LVCQTNRYELDIVRVFYLSNFLYVISKRFFIKIISYYILKKAVDLLHSSTTKGEKLTHVEHGETNIPVVIADIPYILHKYKNDQDKITLQKMLALSWQGL